MYSPTGEVPVKFDSSVFVSQKLHEKAPLATIVLDKPLKFALKRSVPKNATIAMDSYGDHISMADSATVRLLDSPCNGKLWLRGTALSLRSSHGESLTALGGHGFGSHGEI